MLAVAWPFGCPARFANSGGAQTRCAQTMRALFPALAARLGQTTSQALVTLAPAGRGQGEGGDAVIGSRV